MSASFSNLAIQLVSLLILKSNNSLLDYICPKSPISKNSVFFIVQIRKLELEIEKWRLVDFFRHGPCIEIFAKYFV